MRYTTFGRRTGLRVSQYALGTSNFGTRWPTGADEESSRQMFEVFAEAGGTFLDTADTYQFGESETLLGRFLAGRRDHFVVASKYSHASVPNGGLLETGNSRKTMVRALEASLRRLDTDYLDLYWVHSPDFVTPIEEIVSTLDHLVQQGKILHGGLSNFPAWRIARGATLADLRGSASLIGAQFEYSLAARDAERELLPMTEGLGLGSTLYSPLGGGLLTGKYRHSKEGRLTTMNSIIQREDTDQKTAVVDEVLAVATERGEKPSRVAMAWLNQRARRSSTAVVPVIGPRTTDQLDDYLAALEITLTSEQYDRLEKVSTPPLGIPHDGARQTTNAVLGGQLDHFDQLGAVS
ncbi:aldo/keto reductase [Kribbella koreensis]|uniref:Aldo/keto reductase n=1 Tax=Kribbella koreensis TaxID=57909 RepID=A0ABN1Q6B6_9ACTN